MILALLATAFAADNFDAHGFRLGAFNDDPATPLEMSLPASWQPNAFAAGAVFEYAKAPLVRVWDDGTIDPALDQVLALNLSGSWSPASRLRVHFSAPVYFASVGEDGANGADFGDIRLGGDAVLLEGPLSLGVAPFIDLPSGASADNLGQGGLAGGGLLTGRLRQGRAAFGLGLGPYFRPEIQDLGNLQGTDRLLAGAHVGVLATESLGINAELRAELPFGLNEEKGTEAPMELLLHGHNRFDSGFHLVVGGAGSLSQGASAASFRLFVGGGFGTYMAPPPPVLGGLEVQVALDGEPVSGAKVWVTGPEPTELVSAEQPILVGERTPGDTYKATAMWETCHAGLGRAMVPEGGTVPLVVELGRVDAQVRVEVYDQDEQPLPNATITWESEATRCVPGEPLVLEGTHTGTQVVGIGTHAIFVSAPDYSTHQEQVELTEGEDKLIKVTLTKTRVVVKREKIEILEKVFFAFDGDQIDPKSGPLLDEVAQILLDHPEILSVEVGGHTDWEGEDDYNMDLSQRRVDSVRQWLIDKGVAPERLVAKGYGESKPIADNNTEEGRAQNRRVEFNILERDEEAVEEVVPAPAPAPKPAPTEEAPSDGGTGEEVAPEPVEEEVAPEPVEEEVAPEPVEDEPSDGGSEEETAPAPVDDEAAPEPVEEEADLLEEG